MGAGAVRPAQEGVGRGGPAGRGLEAANASKGMGAWGYYRGRRALKRGLGFSTPFYGKTIQIKHKKR